MTKQTAAVEITATPEAAPVAKDKTKPLKKFKITFHGDGGDIEIIHNYKLNVYQRNVETVIDENFLHALKLAVINTIVEVDGKRKEVTIPAYQYTVEPI